MQKSEERYNHSMTQRRTDIVRIIITPLIELGLIFGAFWTTYYLRGITDGIPFVQLRIPEISPEQFAPFVFFGVILWLLIFSRARLYTTSHDIPLFEEIRRVILYASLWFFVYIGFVYLTTGFIFSKEIPRLIVIYTYIL